MTMTLEQVRNRLRGRGEFYRIDPCEERAMADAIDAHLLSQDAEIERLQSRLAAADALLQRARAYHVTHECPECPESECEACLIDAHLSENTHG